MENQKPPFIEENVSLKDFSAFRIGGPARFFCVIRTEEEIRNALDFAIANKLEVFVLGAGSNLLFSDRGFDGLVIKIENRGFEVNESGADFEVRVSGGVYLGKLILDLMKKEIGGLEWAAGIPATVGGAICNNAGAGGGDTAEMVKSVRVFKMKRNPESGYLESYELSELSKESCGFSYRQSIFKSNKDYLIIDAVFLLQKGDVAEMQKIIRENLESRNKKQPLEYPNIGSIFKNPVLSERKMEEILKDYPEEKIKFTSGFIPAGWLIEQIGLKGKKIGGAMISGRHANFIVNVGDAKAEDVMILISLVKQKIRTKFNIQLKEEIEYIGF
ncbi:MAG: UDP-N-acetylmuramate dehydrogenase [Candidatus Pacebacteria bacterium]|nr:UDP-N-acetylmuramate dehydrogenase [Candidatus Paceibacterota bacterium]